MRDTENGMTSSNLMPFCRYTEDDIEADAPKLQVILHAKSNVYVTENTTFGISLRYLEDVCENHDRSRVTIQWDFSRFCLSSRLVLLRHAASGLERIEVPAQEEAQSITSSLEVDEKWAKHGIRSMNADVFGTYTFQISENYVKAMVPGTIYTLLFPGEEITLWDWGAMQTGQILTPRLSGPRLIIPGGVHVTFTARNQEPPWPDRERAVAEFGFFKANDMDQRWRRDNRIVPAPYTNLDKVDEAPRLSMMISLEPPEFHRDQGLTATSTLIYEAPPSARPIVFHKDSLSQTTPQGSWAESTLVFRQDGKEWKYVEPPDSGACGYILVDDEPRQTHVGRDPYTFHCLKPGESFSNQVRIHYSDSDEDSLFPKDMKVSDKFQVRYLGCEIQWWGFGTMKEHEETRVWEMNTQVISGNELRPKLIVPGCSVDVEVAE